jgi:hypothetical protein
MRGIVSRVRPTERAPSAALVRAACALALAAALALGGAGCFGDLVHPTVPAVTYDFTVPLTDTIVNIGDTTPALPCRLTANGAEIGCTLEITVTVGGRFLVERAGRLAANGPGTATVEMRPLNVQSAADSIVRTLGWRVWRSVAGAVLDAGALLAPQTAPAQSLDAAASKFTVQRRLSYRGAVFDQTGAAYGASASFRLGPVRLGASGWSASLAADGGLPSTDVRVRKTAVTLHVAVIPSLLVGVRSETRRFASRFERHDVAITPPEQQRLEQVRGMMVDVGVHLGR